jgi:hypothetical protein
VSNPITTKTLTLDSQDIKEILGVHFEMEVSEDYASHILNDIWQDIYKIVDDTLYQETQNEIRYWIRKNMKEKDEIL